MDILKIVAVICLVTSTDSSICYKGKLQARVLCATRKSKVGNGNEFGEFLTSPSIKLFGPLKATVTITTEEYGYIRDRRFSLCRIGSPAFLYPVTGITERYNCKDGNSTKQLGNEGENIFGTYEPERDVTRLWFSNRTAKLILYNRFYEEVDKLIINSKNLKERAIAARRSRRSVKTCPLPNYSFRICNLDASVWNMIWGYTSCADISAKYPGWQYCQDLYFGDCWSSYSGGHQGSVGSHCMDKIGYTMMLVRSCGYGDILKYTTCKLGIVESQLNGLTGQIDAINTDVANLTRVTTNLSKAIISNSWGLTNAFVELKFTKDQLTILGNASGVANSRIDINERKTIQLSEIQRTMVDSLEALEIKAGIQDENLNRTKAELADQKKANQMEAERLDKKRRELERKLDESNKNHKDNFTYHGEQIRKNLKHALDVSNALHNKATKRGEDIHKLHLEIKDELNNTMNEQKKVVEYNNKKHAAIIDSNSGNTRSLGNFLKTGAGKAVIGTISGGLGISMILILLFCCCTMFNR